MITNDPGPMSQNSVQLRPPIDATMADIDEMLRRLRRVLPKQSGEVNDSHGSTAERGILKRIFKNRETSS
jgi:hypothetical protein